MSARAGSPRSRSARDLRRLPFMVAALAAGCTGSSAPSVPSVPSPPATGTEDDTVVGGIEPTGSPVQLRGRTDERDAAGPRCAWTLCGLSTRVRGGALDVLVGGAPGIVFQVVVDGVPTITFESTTSQRQYRVAEGLPAGDHDVEVIRRSEALWGESQLLGFEPAAGAELVSSRATPGRRLEVIGDSITAGYGNEGCPFSADTENGYLSYAAIAARALGAEAYLEAWSGIGMYRNASGVTAGMMPELYARALPQDASSTWDFSRWIPDAVVVNLGTNDFVPGDPGQPFVDAYVSFVRGLRARYPAAVVLCAVNGNAAIGSAIDRILATLGDPSVKRLDLQVPDWTGCDGHPSVAADRAMAEQLVARLRLELAW